MKELLVRSGSICLHPRHKGTCYVKSVCIQSFSGPYFPAFGLSTKIYFVSIFTGSAGKYRPEKLWIHFREWHWNKDNWSQNKYFTERQDCCKQLRFSLKQWDCSSLVACWSSIGHPSLSYQLWNWHLNSINELSKKCIPK